MFKYHYLRMCLMIQLSKLLLLFFLSVTFIGCRKEKASWLSSWTAPIALDTLKLSDYFNDSTLEVNNDNSIQFILQRDLFELDISEVVKIPDTTIVQTRSIAFPSLTLSPGVNFISGIRENVFEIDDVALREVKVESGIANVTIINPIDVGVVFKIDLPGSTKGGVPFSQTEFVEAAQNGIPGSKMIEIDLSDYTVDMTGEDGISYNTFKLEMSVTTDPNGQSTVVTNQDEFQLELDFRDVIVGYAKGYFGQRIFSDTTIINLDELNNLVEGSIDLNDLNFDIILSNGIKAEGRALITKLSSLNENGSQVDLTHPDFGNYLNVNAAQWDWVNLTPSQLNIPFNSSNSNIIPFVENLANKYELGYEIELNPLGNNSAGNNELFPDSRLYARLEADFPLNLGLDGLKLRDTIEFSIEERDRFIKIQEGSVVLSTNNTFPFGGSIVMRFLDEQYNELTVLEQTEPLMPSHLDVSTNTHVSISQELFFDFTTSQIESLKNAAFVEIEVLANSSSTENNIVYSNAELNFILRANFKLKSSI